MELKTQFVLLAHNNGMKTRKQTIQIAALGQDHTFQMRINT